MKRAAASRLPSTFDNFLFARIGDDPDGGSMSVLSALARLDRDPWMEAATLASMSSDVAVSSLARTIESVPNGVNDTVTTATRLVALLTPSFVVPVSAQGAQANETKVSDRLIISCFLLSWLFVSVFAAKQFAASVPRVSNSDASSMAQPTAPTTPVAGSQ